MSFNQHPSPLNDDVFSPRKIKITVDRRNSAGISHLRRRRKYLTIPPSSLQTQEIALNETFSLQDMEYT